MPTIVFHGDADRTVNAVNAGRIVRASVGADADLRVEAAATGSRRTTRLVYRDGACRGVAELWTVHDAPHAWSGGHPSSNFTDPAGPNATTEVLRIFFEYRLRAPH